jgi:beta-galactosidase
VPIERNRWKAVVHAAVVVAAVFSPSVAQGDSPSVSHRLDKDWRFRLNGDDVPCDPDFDDRHWRLVHVPHNRRELSDEPARSNWKVWLRRRFSLPDTPKGHRVVLEVAGGRLLGAWLNERRLDVDTARERLLVDVTDDVRAGDDNVLLLHAPVQGIQGGVWLHVLHPVHLDDGGMSIDFPDWRGGPARARIRTALVNDSAQAKKAELGVRLIDVAGNELAVLTSGPVGVSPGETRPVDLHSKPLDRPPLWSPENPPLCRAVAELRLDGQVVQTRETTFGFRRVRFDPEEGFILNGEPMKLRGVVYAKIGPHWSSDNRDLWDHEIRLLKGMGVNFVRLTRGVDESLLDACDRAGLLTTVMVPVANALTEVQRNVDDTTARLGNHPSLITWYFNGEGKTAGIAAIQSATAEALRAIDPTRPVLCVELAGRSPGTVGLIDTDVAGHGNYTGWYEGTLDQIGASMDRYREFLLERYGRQLPVVVSSYGAAADSSVHSDRPRRNDYSHEYQTRFHRRFEAEIAGRPWVAGGLVFTFRDVQSAQPIPRHTWKGVLDLDERKRDAYYWYQSIWTDRPMVHVARQDWSPRDVWPPSAKKQVEVFSNCDAVELTVNGASRGRKAKGQGFTWNVSFAEGPLQLRAVGDKNGQRVEETVVVEARNRPPIVEVRLNAKVRRQKSKQLELKWNAVTGVTDYVVYAGASSDFPADEKHRIATTTETSWVFPRPERNVYYKVAARAGQRRGPASPPVGWAPGAMRWRFPNSGWLMASPAVADLDGDRMLEIIFGSYNGKVYALSALGDPLWEFDTGDAVFASPAVAALTEGERPSIAVASSRSLLLLSSDGRLIWKRDGVRQFDRSNKSPAMGDLDGDGRLEIVAGSDTGELLAVGADGNLRWRYSTAGDRNRGLCLTTPVILRDPNDGQVLVLSAADDGVLRLLDAEGRLRWEYDLGLGNRTPGLVPNRMMAAVGRLADDGPVRIVSTAGHLRVLDLRGNLVWERRDAGGAVQISRLFGDSRRQIVLAAGGRLRALDASGHDVWSFRLPDPRDFFTAAPVAADLGPEGPADLVVGTRATRLWAVSGQGELLWDFATVDEINGSPAVADLDGDGFTEVVFGSRDGYLYVVGAGQVKPNAATSLQYRGGPARRAEYCRSRS